MVNELFEELQQAYDAFKREVRERNPRLYEQWKAGGFLIDDDIISMYPNASAVAETLEEDDEDE